MADSQVSSSETQVSLPCDADTDIQGSHFDKTELNKTQDNSKQRNHRV